MSHRGQVALRGAPSPPPWTGSQHMPRCSIMASPRIIIEARRRLRPGIQPDLAGTFDVHTARPLPATTGTTSRLRIPGPSGIAFSAGRHPDVRGRNELNDRVYQYELDRPLGPRPPCPVLTPPATFTASRPRMPSPTETSPSLPDGTRMFVVGANSDKVHQYSLATPWNVTSASYDAASHTRTSSGPRIPFPAASPSRRTAPGCSWWGARSHRQRLPVRPPWHTPWEDHHRRLIGRRPKDVCGTRTVYQYDLDSPGT